MGVPDGRLLPALLVLGLLAIIGSGCTGQASGSGDDAGEFRLRMDSLNTRIAAASTQSGIVSLGSEVQSLRAEAENNTRLLPYLTLLDAQNQTLELFLTRIEYYSKSSSIGSDGPDCRYDYAPFLERLKGAKSLSQSAYGKAQLAGSQNLSGTIGDLTTGILYVDTEGMGAYAEMLGSELLLDCPQPRMPAGQYTLPLSKDGAAGLVVSEVVGESGYYVYSLSDSPLPAGTTIASMRGDGEFVRTLEREAWFFFIDTDPYAPYEHETFFVFVDPSTAEYTVANETYFPIINGTAYLASSEARLDSTWRVYPEPSEGDLTLNLSGPVASHIVFTPLAIASPQKGTAVPLADAECCKGQGKKYAFIMSGYDDPVFDADTWNVYEYLIGQGYSDGDITYLTTDSLSLKSDGVTSLPSVKSAFEGLISKAGCCDKVFIYLAGHGKSAIYYEYRNKNTGETKMVSSSRGLPHGASGWTYTGVRKKLHGITVNPQYSEMYPDGTIAKHGSPNGGRMLDIEFDAYLDRLKSCDTTIMYLSCYSGVAAMNVKGPGRTVITPVGDNPAYGTTIAQGGWKKGGFFTQNFIRAKTEAASKGQADKDKDGQASDKEAFEWARQKTKDFISSRLGKDNTATWTDPERCRCCHVGCDEASSYLCTVREGNGSDSKDCSFIGEYCGPDTLPPKQNETPPTSGNGTLNQTGGEKPPPDDSTAVCGDGKVTGNESCDHGSSTTNKCPEGTYCSKCGCKKLETSVVCGDGKISSPNEDCDGGSVDYKICPSGYSCSICKCVKAAVQCGDGTVTAPEECDHGNTYTDVCYGGKTCSSCRCLDPDDVPEDEPEEAYCGNNAREGAEECDGTDDGACGSGETCQSCSCVQVPDEPNVPECGDGVVGGTEECESDSHCASGYRCSACECVPKETQPAPYCGDGIINGNEQCDGSSAGCDTGGACSSKCACVYPPTLNCDYVCSLTSGTQVVGTNLGSQSECQSAASSFFKSRTCFTTCKYSWYYKVDNIAGWASCCCGVMKEFACTDCPGSNPVCPASGTVCPANAPSWHSPP